MGSATFDRGSLRLAAILLLAGQVLYIVITLFHADGNANDHPSVFAEYAGSASWTTVHTAQFAAMAIMIAGLIALFYTFEMQDAIALWASRFGSALAVASLALYGALQAVDGVANKEADLAWVNASTTEKAARFASAEAVRWIEWGLRSYQDLTLGLALLFLAVAGLRTTWLKGSIAYLIGLAGLICLAQGWVVGTQGFSQTMSLAIVLGEIVSLVWMIWLISIGSRAEPESVMGKDARAKPE